MSIIIQEQIKISMYNSWFEEVRFPLESTQVLQKAIVSQMLALNDNPKDKSIAEQRIKNFVMMIQNKGKEAANFLKEQISMKKEQLAIIEGQKALKASDKKKPSDVIWQNFYDKIKEIKQTYKKQDIQNTVNDNSLQYFRKIVFMPPFKQPQFTMEEAKGKYVDMHTIYLDFINLCKLMDDSNENTKINDYLWFLQNLHKFDDFPMNKKFKHQFKYMKYLQTIEEYLISFLRRSKPLFHIQPFLKSINEKFIIKYQEGNMSGWEPEHENFDESKAQYCAECNKMFITNEAYVNHLPGKKHQKMVQNYVPKDHTMEEQKTRKQFRDEHQKRKQLIALAEFRIVKIKEELAMNFYDTMNLVRKKQTRGYEDVDELVDQSSESQELDAPIYNPKNLPLGWDGKPIPYWLYKLHGLGIQYKCEICGNFSYWGRRAFEMHFQEWRHTYGMRCLKIPNTIHFKDVTTITDALALHEKLLRQSQQSQFRPDIEEEFEDNDGNVLNKRTYYDMKKQGLID